MHFVLAFLKIVVWAIMVIVTIICMCLFWLLGDKDIFKESDMDDTFSFDRRSKW